MWIVTGSNGYVGQHVVRALLNAGLGCVGIDLTSLRDPSVSIPHYMGDFSNTDLLGEIVSRHEIEGLIHLGALKNATQSNVDAELYWKTNYRDSILLVQHLKKLGVAKVIFASSAAVYGDSTPESLDHFSVLESALCLPKNVYGITKLAFEQYLTSLSREGSLESIILRFFNIGGWTLPFSRESNAENLFPLLKRLSETGELLNIYGSDLPTHDGTQIRDYIHIDDVCSAVIASIKKLKTLEAGGNEVFNVGSGKGSSVKEAILAFEKVANKQIQLQYKPFRDTDSIGLVANIKKIKLNLGWQPEYSLYDIAATEAQ